LSSIRISTLTPAACAQRGRGRNHHHPGRQQGLSGKSARQSRQNRAGPAHEVGQEGQHPHRGRQDGAHRRQPLAGNPPHQGQRAQRHLPLVYLHKEKILIEADAYTPGAPGAKPAAAPNNANAVNLVQNVQRLKLAVDTVLPLHGRIAKGEEMMAAGK
jgi:hypothetical protein